MRQEFHSAAPIAIIPLVRSVTTVPHPSPPLAHLPLIALFHWMTTTMTHWTTPTTQWTTPATHWTIPATQWTIPGTQWTTLYIQYLKRTNMKWIQHTFHLRNQTKDISKPKNKTKYATKLTEPKKQTNYIIKTKT
uniref:Uncharacterized protein n=1 Tax=Cacopsylla melanoneura TaxID=428564 RepID=A0A8D9EIX7_9HEMI